jgi:hypothetical protein
MFAAKILRDSLGEPCPNSHSHRHLCWFPSCPLKPCIDAQRDAELYGFTEEGEIDLPQPKRLPWESE